MKLFSAFETEIEVIDREERSPNEELVEDLATIVTHFAERFYGVRSFKYKEVVENIKKLLTKA